MTHKKQISHEDAALIASTAGSRGRHRLRDRLVILMLYHHALRPCELVALRWGQVDLRDGVLHVRRRKSGLPSVHPMPPVEIKHLIDWRARNPSAKLVFTTERGGAMTCSGIHKLVKTVSAAAGCDGVGPAAFRYSYAHRLAEAGYDTRHIRHMMGLVKLDSVMRFVQASALPEPGRRPRFAVYP